MTHSTHEEWEKKTDALIGVWKKYYSEKSSICPDCNGLTWQVCEKSLKEMLGAYVRRVDKEMATLKAQIREEVGKMKIDITQQIKREDDELLKVTIP